MGRHEKLRKSRVRPVAVVLTAAAGAAGTAAAAAPAASAATTEGSTSLSAAQLGTGQLPLRPGALVVTDHTTAAGPRTYTVQPGDNLSDIAKRLCGSYQDWLGIWHATHGIPDPNVIGVGKVLTVECNDVGPGYNPPAVLTSYSQPASDPSGTGNPGYQAPVQQYQAPVQQYQAPVQASGSSWPGGWFGNCVVQRESGGNSQVMNASGHYGLYQFSASTWAAYGGDPAEFGNASVAEQERVFMNAMAAGGESNWSAYDGC